MAPALSGRRQLAAGSLLPSATASLCRSFMRSRTFQKFLTSLSGPLWPPAASRRDLGATVAKCFVQTNDKVFFLLEEAAALEVRPQVVIATPLQALEGTLQRLEAEKRPTRR